MIWFTGSDPSGLSQDEISLIENSLNSGINLFLSSQYIGESVTDTHFVNDVLKAEIVDTSLQEIFVNGVEGDPVSSGISVAITGIGGANNARSLDVIEATGGSHLCFNYGASGKGCGLRFSGDYKLVYLSFPFEAINDNAGNFSHRPEVIKKILRWLGVTTLVSERAIATTGKTLEVTVYPTLVRDEVKIDLLMGEPDLIEVVLYSIDGRRVLTEHGGFLSKGRHLFSLSLKGLPKGVYFIRVKTSKSESLSKIVRI